MEVTGKTSKQDGMKSVDSNKTNNVIYCDPCQNEGEEQPAEGFCEDCQEYLCSSCFKIHRRPAVWRHHVLLDKQLMPTSKTTKQRMIYDCTEPCSIHRTKILEYFCQTHAQLGCPLCVTKNHRLCNDVDYVPDIAEQFSEGTEVKEICDTLQSLKEEIDKYSSTIKKEKVKVEIDEKNAKEQILQIRDELNSICDRLVENVERESECDSSNIKLSLKTCDEIKSKITKRESVIEKKKAELKVSQLFTEAKLSKISIKECKEELESVKERTKTRHFEINFDVEALRQNIQLTYHEQPQESYSPCGNMEQRFCNGTDDDTSITTSRLSSLKSSENQNEELMSKHLTDISNIGLEKPQVAPSHASVKSDVHAPDKGKDIWIDIPSRLETQEWLAEVATKMKSVSLQSQHLVVRDEPGRKAESPDDREVSAFQRNIAQNKDGTHQVIDHPFKRYEHCTSKEPKEYKDTEVSAFQRNSAKNKDRTQQVIDLQFKRYELCTFKEYKDREFSAFQRNSAQNKDGTQQVIDRQFNIYDHRTHRKPKEYKASLYSQGQGYSTQKMVERQQGMNPSWNIYENCTTNKPKQEMFKNKKTVTQPKLRENKDEDEDEDEDEDSD